MDTLNQLNETLSSLAQKQEHLKDRKLVFGDGKSTASLILIGEAPGGEEEKTGTPFVGKAGKNLDEFLEIVGLVRDDIYITNLVKVRPTKNSPKTNKPVNRPPNKIEIAFFKPFLLKEIELINPDYVITLGNFPLKSMLDDDSATIGNFHGNVITRENYNIFPLYHPASIIYNQSLKDVYMNDLIKLKNIIEV